MPSVFLLFTGSCLALALLAGGLIVRKYARLRPRLNAFLRTAAGEDDVIAWLAQHAPSEIDGGLSAPLGILALVPFVIAAFMLLPAYLPWHPEAMWLRALRFGIALILAAALCWWWLGAIGYAFRSRRERLRTWMLSSSEPLLRDSAVTYFLVSALYSRREHERRAAATALVPFVVPFHVDTLVVLLRSASFEVIDTVSAVLEQCACSEIDRRLVAELSIGTAYSARHAAALLQKRVTEATAPLRDALESPRPLARVFAAMVLSEHPDPAVKKAARARQSALPSTVDGALS